MGACISGSVQQHGKKAQTQASIQKQPAQHSRRLTLASFDGREEQSNRISASAPSSYDPLSDFEAKALGIMQCSAKTMKGTVPYDPEKLNQDRAFVQFGMQGDADICLFGVLDGHGTFGHLVSSFVQEKLPHWLEQSPTLKTDTTAAIRSALIKTCEELEETYISLDFSGTTAVFGVKVGGCLYVANIGDSRCVMGVDDGHGHVVALALSQDHRPDRPDEKARILAAGGRVRPLPGPPGECGPHRVWLKEADVPGLAMSRSIGDLVSQTVGVTSAPDIVTHHLNSSDLFCIWASDGVFEFMSNQEAVDIVNEHRNVEEAAHALVQASRRRWHSMETCVDDITCVILKLQ